MITAALGALPSLGSLGGTLGSIAGWMGNNLPLLGTIGGALGGIASNVLGNVFGRKNTKAAQKQAAELNYYYTLKAAENLPTSQRKGLEAAGYNPMLALNGGSAFNPGVSSASHPYQQAGSVKDMAELGKDLAGLAKEQLDNLKADTKAKEAQGKLIDAQKTRTEVDTVMDVVGGLGSGASAVGSAYTAKKLYDLSKPAPSKPTTGFGTPPSSSAKAAPLVRKIVPAIKHAAKSGAHGAEIVGVLATLGALGYLGVDYIQSKSPTAKKMMDYEFSRNNKLR